MTCMKIEGSRDRNSTATVEANPMRVYEATAAAKATPSASLSPSTSPSLP